MIIVKLDGGLGNQMFQYALGRYLSFKHNTVLKLDISQYEKENLKYERKFELGNFNITASIANKEEINLFFGKNYIYNKCILIKKKYYKFINKNYKDPIILEKQFHFDSNILLASNNIYLKGWWQSEKYFHNIEDIIRKEFIFNKKCSPQNINFINEIIKSCSVSIHIRRGDYVMNPKINNYHGVCDLDYYERAVNFLEKKFKNLNYYIFSDDIDWVKNNFTLKKRITFIDYNNGDDSIEDMRLMSYCKHNIIANSSFSWWSAWLNNYPEKIVIAPLKWFNMANNDTKDLIPEKWIRL